MTAEVVFDRRDRVLLITLDRPAARNAMTPAMATAIGEAIERAAADDDVGAIVITGAGTAFCAGGDKHVINGGRSIHSPEHPEWGFGGMRHHFVPKPVVAAVNGAALGGGFELCLAADLVVAVEGAQMGLPEVALGVPPNAGGALRLMQHLPRKRAVELILGGAPITAETAFEWGLVNRVVPAAGLLDVAIGMASAMARFDPATVAATKWLAYGATDELADEATRWHRRHRPPGTP